MRRGAVGAIARAWRVSGLLIVGQGALLAQTRDPGMYLANDSHFHLTNYIQEGPSLSEFLRMMGTSVGRAAVFGIPLQQQWSYRIDGNRAPSYYLDTDAPLYYYSFTDAAIARAYEALPKNEQARFDPMITGFNPTDMYAADHIRRVLQLFPGVFTGIGEFTIHKEFVSSKVTGDVASLTDPALDRILDFAADVGLVVILHSDIDVSFAKGSPAAYLNLPSAPPESIPAYFGQLAALFKRHPKTTLIWAHTGVGRTVLPVARHLKVIRSLIDDPALPNLYFDISWKVVADYITASDSSLTLTAALLNQHPDRFLFGSDALAPPSQDKYMEVYREYEPLWKRLSPAASAAVRKGNYERIFDEGRRRVRAWERAHRK